MTHYQVKTRQCGTLDEIYLTEIKFDILKGTYLCGQWSKQNPNELESKFECNV